MHVLLVFSKQRHMGRPARRVEEGAAGAAQSTASVKGTGLSDVCRLLQQGQKYTQVVP